MPSSGVGEESFRSPTIFVDRWPDWGAGRRGAARRIPLGAWVDEAVGFGARELRTPPLFIDSWAWMWRGCNGWSVVVVFVAGVVGDDEAVGLAADGSGCDDLAIGDIDGHDLPVEWIGDPHVVV